MDHLNDEDLILHFYGELEETAERAAKGHLTACAQCRGSYTRLQRVLAVVDAIPEPALPEGFERVTWARLQPALGPGRNWRSWLAFSSTRFALAAAVVVLIAGAFFAGRMSRDTNNAAVVVSADQLREQILLSDLGEHLDRSKMMLIDLVSADDETSIDLPAERRRAEELVAANRLYRQTAEESGEVRVTELLDELERLLVDLAASPDTLSAKDRESLRQRIDANGLLFKVRVLSTMVRERQKEQIRMRSGRSSQSSD